MGLVRAGWGSPRVDAQLARRHGTLCAACDLKEICKGAAEERPLR